MKKMAILSILLLGLAVTAWSAPLNPQDPMEAQDVNMTMVYHPLLGDCTPLVQDTLLDPLSDGMNFDTTVCFRNGINIIFQLRPGNNAPDTLKGVPFTVDLRDIGCWCNAISGIYGDGIQANTSDNTTNINVTFIHKPDNVAHKTSADSANSGQYNALEADTFYFDFTYRSGSGPTWEYLCSCGADTSDPHFMLHSNLWGYGHLRRYEILNGARTPEYSTVTRTDAAGPGCGGAGTVMAVCESIYITGVTPSHPITLIKDFALNAPYPNPFSFNTSLRYEVPSEGNVTLAVTNVKGEKVKTLFDGKRSSGSYVINWDGTDDNSVNLANGVYYLEMHSKDFHNRQRVVLMR
jgi:hypothetical protein